MNSILKTFLLSIMMVANTHFAYSQTASILPPAKTTFTDNNGKPLSGGKVYHYVPGTTTAKTTWQDAGETIPNSQPVVLDSSGRALILGDGSYRQIVRDKLGNLIWDAATSSTGSGGGGSSATVGDGDPVGMIKSWAGFVAPTQYVFAYGQEYVRASYPELFQAITLQKTVTCTSGSATISSISDTSQLMIGSPIETSCLNAGATIVSKTSSTVVASSTAIVSVTSSATFFPYGNGNGTSTFNLPDLRGRTLSGRDNMGGTSAGNLTTAYFGTDPNATGAKGGNQSNTLVTGNLPPYTPSGSVASALSGATWIRPSVAAQFGSDFRAFGNAGDSALGTTAVTGTVTSTFTGSAQGGGSTPFSNVSPTVTTNYIIKVLPDTNPNSYFGVASLGGMYGVITCGTGVICAGNSISTLSTAPVYSDVSGVPAHTILGNNTGSTANTIAMTPTQATAELDTFSSSLKGLVPPSGGGTSNFLRADGTFAAPSGGGGLTPIGARNMLANNTGGSAVPTGVTPSDFWDGFCSTTIGNIWVRQTGGWGCLSAGYVNPVWYGADPTGSADSTTAFNNAIATNLPIFWPKGIFKFNSAISVTLPAYPTKNTCFCMTGSGGNATTLFWPNAGGGITITATDSRNNVEISKVHFTTAQVNSGQAIKMIGLTAYYNPISVISDVQISGDDLFTTIPGDHHWFVGLSITNWNNVSVNRLNTFGRYVGGGIGLFYQGDAATSSYSTVLNVSDSSFNLADQGVLLGSYWQGVTLNNINCNGQTGSACVYQIPSATGVLALLTVVNSEMNTGGIQIDLESAIDTITIANNTITCHSNGCIGINVPTGLGVMATSNFLNLSSGATSTIGINLGSTGTSGVITGTIIGNIFANSWTFGVALQSKSDLVTVGLNAYYGPATKVLNSGSTNSVGTASFGNMTGVVP